MFKPVFAFSAAYLFIEALMLVSRMPYDTIPSVSFGLLNPNGTFITVIPFCRRMYKLEIQDISDPGYKTRQPLRNITWHPTIVEEY